MQQIVAGSVKLGDTYRCNLLIGYQSLSPHGNQVHRIYNVSCSKLWTLGGHLLLAVILL